MTPATRRPAQGFTLIELLVAVSILSILAVMAWRALDHMQQGSAQTRIYTNAVLTIDAGLAQWVTDLESMQEIPNTTTIDWNGRALRITRRHATDPNEGVLVVAWTRDEREGTQQWLRWQSAPVRTREAWASAWRSAEQWVLNQNATERVRETAIAPLNDWQIYYFRGGAWSNALSSAGTPRSPAISDVTVPDGVRLVLTLPASHPLAGTLTRDWAHASVAAKPS
jgi:general secretion pathway protein J